MATIANCRFTTPNPNPNAIVKEIRRHSGGGSDIRRGPTPLAKVNM